jgi:hypothetical protein
MENFNNMGHMELKFKHGKFFEDDVLLIFMDTL